jgi:hypothetical protein
VTRTITISSCKIRAAFEDWLQSECQSGARLIVLQGLTGSGKTTLSERPFSIGAGKSVNIEIDQFCRQYIPLRGLRYLQAIDQAALRTRVRAALDSGSPAVVVEGPVAWPLIARIARADLQRVRRVYLKRMMRLKPDFWVDEDFLKDPARWPPLDFHRSIYQYHARQRPWRDADLVLERIEDNDVSRTIAEFVIGRR